MEKEELECFLELLAGKTIEKAELLDAADPFLARIQVTFTDKKTFLFAPFDPGRVKQDEEVYKAFITLWDKAGTTDYIKKEWKDFGGLLESRGIRLW